MTTHFAGIDIGGTTIKVLVVDEAGHKVLRHSEPTESDVVAHAQRLAATLVANDPRIAGIGLVSPGMVDGTRGRVEYASNLNLRDTDLGAAVSTAAGRPVQLDHDGRATGIAEGLLGAARDVTSFIVVPIGTGISAAICPGGIPLVGSTFSAGEIGHTPIFPGGELCVCGQRGCLEVYASATGIARRYQALTGTATTALEVERRLSDSPAARQIWNQAAEALALSFTHLTLTLDPALIVIAGGLSKAGETLLKPVRQHMATLLLWRALPTVVASLLANESGQWGATILGAQVADSQAYLNWSIT